MVRPTNPYVAGRLALLLAGVLAAHLSVLAAAPKKDSRAQAVRLNNLGVAYLSQQRFDRGVELFEQALKLDPKLPAARLNRGIALLNLQRYDAAREILLEVARREPRNTRAWYNLGLLYRNLGQPEPARKALEHARELDPDDADTHYFLGTLQVQLQNYDAALASYQQALKLNPLHASAEFGLATVYQRRGDASRAREHLARFQQLTQENLAFPTSLAYGDQGKYSLAEQIALESEAVPQAISVRFASAAAQVGLDFKHAGGLPEAGQAERATGGLAAFLGSGACFLDYDGDGHSDLFLVNSGPNATSSLYRSQGGGRFVNSTEPAGLEVRGYGLGCTAGDYDNDGWTDLAVSFAGRVALFRNQGDGTFRETTEEAGIHSDGFLLGITFVDYDHDGDLDLYLTRFVEFPDFDPATPFRFPFGAFTGSNVLWRNNGNGTFTEWTQNTGLEGAGPSVAAVATDFNNDRAIDLVLSNWGKAPLVLLNPREGKFHAAEPWTTPMPAPTAGLVVFDFDKDGWMDLVFTHWGAPGLTLWRNVEGRRAERVPLPDFGWTCAWGVAAVDYDNDGWLDLVAVGETDKKSELRLLRNRGPAGFDDRTAHSRLNAVSLQRPRALLAADYDEDGDVDLLLTQNRGPVVLLRNDGGNKNNWLRVSLKGLADNKSAVGTKVEIFAGTLYQKWEVQAGSGYLSQNPVGITAGLGQAKEADILRMLWPTGVVQDEIQLAANQDHGIDELNRRGSSCPILFTWNGSRYEFIADIIGAGIVGHWVAPGVRNVPDPTEYVRVEGRQLQPENGRLRLRLIEPMEELVYLDHVRLLAVDHPAGTEVYPNEYFAGSPPFPEFKVIASRRTRPLEGAWDDKGRDVQPELGQRDGHYVDRLGSLPFKGFASLHWVELELGEWDPNQPIRLLLRGFIEYFTATSVYAAHQAGVEPVGPYVEAQDTSGRWVRVVDSLGFPAGLPRTMVADLTGRLPAGTRRIRIASNLLIYWDQILVDTTAEQVPVRLSETPLVDATLSSHGYPRAVEGNPSGNVTYVYEEVSATGPYARHVGAYTRYGDVRELLTDGDDRFAIFGSGEEVALEFDAQSLPAVPAGWQRDYFFYADGFDKDMDFYEAHFLTVSPLPFHRMSGYPYAQPEDYPASEPYLRYQLEYNTRGVSGRGVRSFRFE